ncbi:MAG: type II toxin-antitoxin system RelE/ParE family toxin [Saprospiraceae bacterium]|nr:type II toxin-antitoxin system RelE/ParE family toxin [Saprospiraceae bacterium]
MDDELDIGWSNRVGKDLLAIKAYMVENGSEAIAEKVIVRIFSAVEPARTQPERFPYEPRFKKYGNFRYIKVWSYKIIYEFTGNQIIVHRVIHSKRDLQKLIKRLR